MTSRAEDLVGVLDELGVEVHKVVGDEICGRCPVHHKAKGRDSHRYSWYMNVDSGLWRCFTCGSSGNLPSLVSDLTDDLMILWRVQSSLIMSGLRRLNEDEAAYDPQVSETIDWMTYAAFDPLPESVIKVRNLDPDMVVRFGVKWDPEHRAMTLPIVSPLGELRGWQLKKTGSVWSYPTGVNRHDTFFGIERAFSDTALVVESPLDVVRFHSVYGEPDINCLGAFGAALAEDQVRLLYRKFDRLIIALDNDNAGAYHTKRLTKMLPSFRHGVWYWKYNEGAPKDLGEMTDGQIIRGLGAVSRVPT
jgi:hypothetical protein